MRVERSRGAGVARALRHGVPAIQPRSAAAVISNVLMGRISYSSTLATLFMRFSVKDRTLAIRALPRLDMVSHGLHRADELSAASSSASPSRARSSRSRRSFSPTSRSRPSICAMRRSYGFAAAYQQEDGIHRHLQSASSAAAKDYCDRIIGMRKGPDRVRTGCPGSCRESIAREIYGGGDPGDEDVELALTATSAPTTHDAAARTGTE